MKRRKAISVKMQVTLAFLQAEIVGLTIPCALCREPLGHGEPRILEHMIPHATITALGGDPDMLDNLRWVHKSCAHRKTYGTKATTAGSDAHAIAKGKRFDRVNAGERSRKRRGPKMKSRGFGPNTKKFSGAVSPSKRRKPTHARTD